MAIEVEVAAELPEGFLQTEIGPLPADWRVARLSDVAVAKYGKSKPKTTGNVPVIGSGGIYGWTDEVLVDLPTIVVGRKGTAGEIWHVDGPCWPSDTTFYLQWETDVEVAFLSGYLRLHKPSGEHAKTTLPSLQKHELENTLIPLPPLEEQRAIARVLSTIQRAIEATDKVIAAARRLKRSLMRHLFTYGPVPVAEAENVPLKETEIGPVPEHWQVVRLGDLVGAGKLLLKNGFPQGAHNQSGNGVPHLRPFNISEDGEVALSQIKYVEPPPADSPAWIRRGDVIFNNTNSEELVGKTAYFDADGEYVLSNHMTIVRVLDAEAIDAYCLSKQFYYLWRRGVFTGLCRRHVNQASVSLERLKGVTLPLPPLKDQQAIARALLATEQRIGVEEKRRTALKELFRAMLQLLMTGQVRVKGL